MYDFKVVNQEKYKKMKLSAQSFHCMRPFKNVWFIPFANWLIFNYSFQL